MSRSPVATEHALSARATIGCGCSPQSVRAAGERSPTVRSAQQQWCQKWHADNRPEQAKYQADNRRKNRRDFACSAGKMPWISWDFRNKNRRERFSREKVEWGLLNSGFSHAHPTLNSLVREEHDASSFWNKYASVGIACAPTSKSTTLCC